MANLSGKPICRRCRREGEKLFLKGERCSGAKCAFTRRSYPPGMHGMAGARRFSGFARQLREKQKAKSIYGLSERQLKNYYKKAIVTEKLSLLALFELRLDNIIYRLGFAPSRKSARQLIGHGLFTVNGKKVSIPSFQAKAGDLIGIKKGKEEFPAIKNMADNLKRITLPDWLQLDLKSMTAKVLALPKEDQITTPIRVSLIIEYYSR